MIFFFLIYDFWNYFSNQTRRQRQQKTLKQGAVSRVFTSMSNVAGKILCVAVTQTCHIILQHCSKDSETNV